MKTTSAFIGFLFIALSACGSGSKDASNNPDPTEMQPDWLMYLNRVDEIKSHPEVQAVALPFTCWPETSLSALYGEQGPVETPTKFCRRQGMVMGYGEIDARLGALGNEASYVRYSRGNAKWAPYNLYLFSRAHFTYVDSQNWQAALLCSIEDISDVAKPTYNMQKTLQVSLTLQDGHLVTNSVEEIPYSKPGEMDRTPDVEICAIP